MKANFKKVIVLYFVWVFMSLNTTFGQGNRFLKSDVNDLATVMTWNKNTPEQEMLDDIKALKEQGIAIKYSNIKRNTKGEIIALRIEYRDLEGNYGSQEYYGNKPIAPIKFYKNKNGIGFGDNNPMGMAFSNFDDLHKSFGNQIQMNPLLKDDFGSNSDSDSRIKKKSKIIIQEGQKKPLVIEDGEVIKGGEDYTEEEIEKIKNQNQFEWNENDKSNFNFNSDEFDIKSMKEQMDKIQNQLLQMMPKHDNDKNNSNDLQDVKPSKEIVPDDLKQAKEELLKAKKQMEEATKELQKAKSEIQMRKI